MVIIGSFLRGWILWEKKFSHSLKESDTKGLEWQVQPKYQQCAKLQFLNDKIDQHQFCKIDKCQIVFFCKILQLFAIAQLLAKSNTLVLSVSISHMRVWEKHFFTKSQPLSFFPRGWIFKYIVCMVLLLLLHTLLGTYSSTYYESISLNCIKSRLEKFVTHRSHNWLKLFLQSIIVFFTK